MFLFEGKHRTQSMTCSYKQVAPSISIRQTGNVLSVDDTTQNIEETVNADVNVYKLKTKILSEKGKNLF